ncbi:Putative peptidase M35, deuterolysin, metallopeptidase, catalytic domain superfamily [Septoria linicola]|uniref:Neutral protease 2 n=1 Tax=Septoria linicola TaxID=215465 RepID=A0A9Q9EMF8_9PEZI|nr:putative peptidase M35, deuterolysin, metallopeptidase, catalytic domain superfamily [Septoria linicola]USW55995.1 Putative peptidase M35, deuterolysin, metallopeptidase, catalytic domain superfamily [Septoria linicola]
MQFSLLVSATWVAFASIANGAAIDLLKRSTPLTVELTPLGNSKVKAAVTNNDARGYNLFYKGSFLDGESPVDKFTVNGPASRASFNGVLLRMATSHLEATQFVPIEPGQTIETEIDVAELYDVETSDSYTVRATGSMPYAELNSTTLSGHSVAYSSNTITMDIDGDQAKDVPYAVHKFAQRRTELTTNGCSSQRRAAIQTALSNCADLADNAAAAAAAGHGLREYFKSSSSSVANTVSARFKAIAQECASTTGGVTETSCADEYGYCQKGVLGYTLPSMNYIGYCDIFYEYLDPISSQCHEQDQATTVLHEKTHAPAVYSPGTQDYAYGYEAAMDLSSQQAVNNADTYALYANALYAGC